MYGSVSGYGFNTGYVANHPIDYSDVLITGPTLEPLDIEEVKKQRRFASTSIDTLFDMWIGAGREDFEEMTGLALLTQTREFALDGIPWQTEIQLNRGPVQSIVSIKYDDADNVEQTWDAANYTLLPKRTGATSVETYPSLGSVALVPSKSWPATGCGPKSLRIRYICGYGDAPGAVPNVIQYVLQMYVGTAHKYGESLQELRGSNLTIPGVEQVMRNARTRRTIVPTR